MACPDCVCDQFDFPPTFKYHILDGHAPTLYYYFWPIGTVCCAVTAFIIFPSIATIKAEANELRDQMDTALLPYGYQICSVILVFPLIGVVFNELVLIAPVTRDLFIFLLNLYNALTLYSFARLLIMYLGSYNNAIKVWRSQITKPTKFYASKPCCCLRICLKEKRMEKRDFRRIYYLIQQYIIIGPFSIFLSLFMRTAVNAYYHDLSGKIVGAVQISSSIGCLYASQALLNVSRDLLKDYEIVGKFKMVQFGIMTLTVPSAVLSLTGVDLGINGVYTSEVMNQAWSSVISCVLYTVLSYFYAKYFNVQTARNAMRNAQNSSYTASLTSKTKLIDLVDREAKETETGQPIDSVDLDETKLAGNTGQTADYVRM